jgi:hypothetical protein
MPKTIKSELTASTALALTEPAFGLQTHRQQDRNHDRTPHGNRNQQGLAGTQRYGRGRGRRNAGRFERHSEAGEGDEGGGDEGDGDEAGDTPGQIRLRRLLHPIEDACQILGGVSRTKIYEEMKAGRINPTKIGSRTFIAHSELLRYIAALSRTA